MPSGKSRTKDDTWKEADLKKALQVDKKKDRSDEKSKSSERRSDRDEDRRRRKEARDDIANGDDRERRRKEKDSERDKRKDREREGERSSKSKESRRDKEKQREPGGESSGIGREDKGSRDHDDRERRKTRDKESDRERRHRSRREPDDHDKDEGKSRDKERTSERDKERHSRRREEKESSSQDKDAERRRERDHRDRRKERENDDLLKPRDENREKRRERTRDKDGRERRKDRHDDGSRERREKSRDDRDRRKEHGDSSRERGRDKSRDREDRHRRKEKEKHEAEKENRAQRREKEMLASLQKEEDLRSKQSIKGERFRADTLETADVVDEEEVGNKRQNLSGQQGSSTQAEEIEEDGVADDYDDDFEDYEDDFENEEEEQDDGEEENTTNAEDRNAGMQELLKAINLENETVRALSREGSKLSRSSDDDSKRDTPSSSVTPTARGRINFVAAKQKQISEKVASRTRKRGQELMHLIDLDVAVFEMFDLPPMNEYDLYIKNFGRSDTTQAYVQCNDDNLEKEIQTEEIETRTMWTQNPAETFAGCGGEDGSKDDLSAIDNRPIIDSIRLTRFLESAGQVCLVLLEEASADKSSTMVKEKKDMTCSDGYIPLATKQPYLAGRVIESIHISPVQSHFLLTAYGPVVNQTKNTSIQDIDVISTKSVVCLWNLNEPSQPQKVLLCESVPLCCCLSPSKATIAFAGLEDGSVVSWDLRESSPVHHTLNIENTQVTFRPPTFSTAGVLSQDNHHSPVVSLRPVVMPGDSMKASSSLGSGLRADDMVGLSFQLASLEEDAVVHIWVVVELDAADIAGSESDLGLAPGGKIKLIKSASLTLELPMRGIRKTTALQTFCMRLLPQDPNHFYVGTDTGCVLHRIRHGGRAPPRAYKPKTDCLVDVTAIDVSPWQLPCILAGSRDGSVRLYHLNNEYPRSTWTNSTQGSPIVSVQWSRSVPNVFFVLDDNSILHTWNLLQNESSPVAIDKIKQGRVVCFELSSDYTASGIGVPGRNPEMVLGYESGTVEVHKISSRYSKASADELDRFNDYLEAVM